MLSFISEGTMKRVAMALKNMGGENFICVNSYRDVILQQAFYRHNKKFLTNMNDIEYDDKLPEGVYVDCPMCGQTLDDADFDFQICHHCGWNGNNKE